MNATATRQASKFCSGAFWAVGLFCFYWETKVFSAAHRFMDVDMAPLGACSSMEAAIFTLSLAFLPLVILHLIVHQYQRLAGAARPRFPGTIDDLEVPDGLKWMRVCLFMVLCVWPTFCHAFLTLRTFDHYGIIPGGVIKTEPQDKWPAIHGARLLAFPCGAPEHPKWTRGTEAWWVNLSRSEWREIKQPSASKDDKPVFDRVAVTALPFQPMFFGLGAVLAVWSTSVAVVNGLFSRRCRGFFLQRLR